MGRKFRNLTGERFERLVVLRLYSATNPISWVCRCDCGREKVIKGGSLMNRMTKSCGCLRSEMRTAKNKREVGEKSPNWEGKKIGYFGLHVRMRKILKKPTNCTYCKEEKRLEMANISQKYKHDVSDWMWLCRKCHNRYDHEWRWKNNRWFKKCTICKKYKEVNIKNFQYEKDDRWMRPCITCYLRK